MEKKTQAVLDARDAYRAYRATFPEQLSATDERQFQLLAVKVATTRSNGIRAFMASCRCWCEQEVVTILNLSEFLAEAP